MGKTHLAAFDFEQSGYRNLLFIAHRENILSEARKTFRTVLGRSDFGSVLSGATTDEEWGSMRKSGSSVFAMVQTLSKRARLDSFSKDHFEYVVIDEFHHSKAGSYIKVLRHFVPRFLLGLTATPERMDGRDVLEHCEGNIAYEMRLFEAIENRWLVPFQYYAIYDETDYKQLKWTSRGYEPEELTALLKNDTRARLIVHNLRKYLPSNGKVKALAFCSSKVHARFMSRKFNDIGFASVCILGEDAPGVREETMRRLEDESDELNVICSVEVFGEGVDIPSVSHVLFLRPTQSFTVFLQQLGRGLRLAPEKEFMVVLDFVGNFRQSYVAPLALRGYRNIEERRNAKERQAEKKLPAECYVSADTDVERVWDKEIKRIVKNSVQALKDLYREMKQNMLEESPSLMDFYANPAACDPYEFVKCFGGWLRTKKEMGDLDPYEAELLDTPGERFLVHLEKDLKPNKSYKMVVLTCLLSTSNEQHEWQTEEIAAMFKQYYLEHREHLHDYTAMGRFELPEDFPVKRVISHIKKMPLDRLSDTDDKFFKLTDNRNRFILKNQVASFWQDERYRGLIRDRVEFALLRYLRGKGIDAR